MLVLGGLRAEGPWSNSVDNPTEKDLATLEELNKVLNPRGISIHIGSREHFLKHGYFEMVSLAGAERVSRSTNISWIEPFDASTGWDGYHRWRKELDEKTEEVMKQDPALARGQAGFHMTSGVLLGYPDRACHDFKEVLGRGGSSEKDMAWTCIPYTGYYTTGVPSFAVLPGSFADPGVVGTTRTWGEFLGGFYTDPCIQSLESDPAFVAARKERYQGRNIPSNEETIRLGLASPSPHALTGRGREGKDQESDLVFRTISPRLIESLPGGCTGDDILKRGNEAVEKLGLQHCGITEMTLETWLAYGELYRESPYGQFYDEAARSNPGLISSIVGNQFNRCLRGMRRMRENPGDYGEYFHSSLMLRETELLDLIERPSFRLYFTALPRKERRAMLDEILHLPDLDGTGTRAAQDVAMLRAHARHEKPGEKPGDS